MFPEHDKPVAIVGGGVIGVCCAYFLAKAGVGVLLFEKDEICSGCSLGNLGLLAASHAVPLASPGVVSKALKWLFDSESPFAIRWSADPKLLSWLWQFFQASRSVDVAEATADLVSLVLASTKLFEELADSVDFSFGLEKRGTLELFATSRAFSEAGLQVPSLRAAGLRVDVLDAAGVQQFEPLASPDVCGGLFYYDDCHVLPAAFVRGLASAAGKAGVKIRPQDEVTGFELAGDRITTVNTRSHSIQVSAVVLAAGSYSPALLHKLEINLPVQPARGYSFTIPAPRLLPQRPIMFAEARALLTPMGNELRLGGVLELTNRNTPVDALRAKALVRSIERYLLPQISFDWQQPWSGYRPCSPDGFPIVGWSQRSSNLLYATGHGMLGLSLGPLTGEIVSNLVTGASPRHDLTRWRPSRFPIVL